MQHVHRRGAGHCDGARASLIAGERQRDAEATPRARWYRWAPLILVGVFAVVVAMAGLAPDHPWASVALLAAFLWGLPALLTAGLWAWWAAGRRAAVLAVALFVLPLSVAACAWIPITLLGNAVRYGEMAQGWSMGAISGFVFALAVVLVIRLVGALCRDSL